MRVTSDSCGLSQDSATASGPKATSAIRGPPSSSRDGARANSSKPSLQAVAFLFARAAGPRGQALRACTTLQGKLSGHGGAASWPSGARDAHPPIDSDEVEDAGADRGGRRPERRRRRTRLCADARCGDDAGAAVGCPGCRAADDAAMGATVSDLGDLADPDQREALRRRVTETSERWRTSPSDIGVSPGTLGEHVSDWAGRGRLTRRGRRRPTGRRRRRLASETRNETSVASGQAARGDRPADRHGRKAALEEGRGGRGEGFAHPRQPRQDAERADADRGRRHHLERNGAPEPCRGRSQTG